MPALPSQFYFDSSTTVEIETGVVPDMTDDGEVNLRDLYTREHTNINAVFRVRDTTEKDTLLNFLRTYRMSDITFTLDGTNYSAKITTPAKVNFTTAGYTQITVVFRAVVVV